MEVKWQYNSFPIVKSLLIERLARLVSNRLNANSNRLNANSNRLNANSKGLNANSNRLNANSNRLNANIFSQHKDFEVKTLYTPQN